MSSKAALSFLCVNYKSFNFAIIVRIYYHSVFFIQAICVAARQSLWKASSWKLKKEIKIPLAAI